MNTRPAAPTREVSNDMKTYDQMHHGLEWHYGPASNRTCSGCERPANNWCYQYPATGEKISPEGQRYSERFEDYAPMCWSCHKKFDYTKDPRIRESMGRNLARGEGWKVLERRRLADPELAQRLYVIRSANGRVAGAATNAIRRACAECGLTSNPPGVGRHQKFSGHTGWETVA